MSRTAQLTDTSARTVILDLPSGPIATLEAGPPEGPGVLLVPGYTGSKEDFGPILDPLAAAGLCVTAIDLPGQFESPGPDDPAEYAPARLAGRVIEIAQRFGDPPHLLGHSFGGLVARAALIERPDCFRDLVLMDSGPAAIEGLRRARIESLEPLLPLGLDGLWDAMQAALETEPGFLPPPHAVTAFMKKRFLAGSPAMLEGMGLAIRREPDRVEELRATGVRTLVLCGSDDDAWLPSVQKEMADRLDAAFVAVPHAAHSPAVENPAATVAALADFWSER